jgi:SAM-dependent methyltransferase
MERRWRSFEETLGTDRGGVAVELGAGTGVYMDRASRLFKEITAVDGSAGMLGQLQKRLSNARLGNVKTLQANVLSMPTIADGSIDVVYFFGLLEHILDVDAFVREVARILKKGGVVIGTTPNARSPWYGVRKLVRGTDKHCSSDRYYTNRDVTAMFAKADFRAEYCDYWGGVPAGVKSGLTYGLLSIAEKVAESTPLRYWVGSITFRLRRQ